MYDITNLETKELSEKGMICKIKDLEGNETPIEITCCGHDSKHYRNAEKKIKEEFAKLIKAKKEPDQNQKHNYRISILAALVRSWKNVGKNGKALQCNRKNVESFLDSSPAVADQIDIFTGDRRNFLANAGKN